MKFHFRNIQGVRLKSLGIILLKLTLSSFKAGYFSEEHPVYHVQLLLLVLRINLDLKFQFYLFKFWKSK